MTNLTENIDGTSTKKNQSDTPVLEVRRLKKHYQEKGFIENLLGRGNVIKSVDGINLKIWKNEVYGLVGESGSGKSTFAEIIPLLRKPTAGEIIINGQNILELSDNEMRELRRKVQIIFQDPYSSLNPRKTIYQSLKEPIVNLTNTEPDNFENKAINVLSDVGLRPPENFLTMYPGQLSGGQQQRINIARAVLPKPDLLIADEPMSMLDVSIQSGIIKLFNKLQSEYGFSLLFISHNLSLIGLLSDRVGVIYKGKIVEQGKPRDVIQNPKHPYTQALSASLPDVLEERERVDLTTKGEDLSNPAGCNFHPRCPDRMDECIEHEPNLVASEGRKVACFLYHNSRTVKSRNNEDINRLN